MANKFFSSLPWQGKKATGAKYVQKKGTAPSPPAVTDTEIGYPGLPGPSWGNNPYNRKTKVPTIKTHVTKKGIH